MQRSMPTPAPTGRATQVLAALGAVAALVGVTLVATAEPAAAAITVTAAGTTVTATVVGNAELTFTCYDGTISVGGQHSSPTLACGSVTKITVNGDGGAQTIDGDDLEASPFAAKPYLVAKLGAGNDVVTPTSRADDIDLGAGDDILYQVRGATDTQLEGGANNDYIRIEGSDALDTVVASSTNATLTVSHKVFGIVKTATAKDFERIEAATFQGNDSVDFSGITATSTLKEGGIYAGDGDDIIRGPQFAGVLSAGPGNNQVFGGSADDNISSEGNGDVIKGGAGTNSVYDRFSGRSGRIIDSGGTDNWYQFEGNLGDTVSRIRPGGSGSTLITNSLTRPGHQVLPSTYKNIASRLVDNGSGTARGLVDIVALDGGRNVFVDGDSGDDDLLDVTVPVGSWTTSGTPQATYFISPTNAAYPQIEATDFGSVSIHGPWSNKNNGFVHRVTRDLLFRFETAPNVALYGSQIGTGTITRAQFVHGLMDTDEYRGLDVDRAFTRFLRRSVDPGGRTYWINSIKGGKELWRFRAQLFGSNEYFTKAGGTNGAYLDHVYQDVLGRVPDAAGRAYWVAKLDGGADRGSVALQFINTSEFRHVVIDDQFLRFLDRKATPSEVTTWTTTLATSPTGEQDLIASLAASTAYFDRT